MAEHLIDTNVLSEIFYGNAAIRELVEELDSGIDTVIYIESIQGAISKQDKEKIKSSLARLKYYFLTPETALLAIELIDKYSIGPWPLARRCPDRRYSDKLRSYTHHIQFEAFSIY